jgi:hypothetical protein
MNDRAFRGQITILADDYKKGPSSGERRLRRNSSSGYHSITDLRGRPGIRTNADAASLDCDRRSRCAQHPPIR